MVVAGLRAGNLDVRVIAPVAKADVTTKASIGPPEIDPLLVGDQLVGNDQAVEVIDARVCPSHREERRSRQAKGLDWVNNAVIRVSAAIHLRGSRIGAV